MEIANRDLQATILQCLGIEHERLTYRFGGRDFRLTDVAGKVVREVLALRSVNPWPTAIPSCGFNSSS